MLQFEFIFVFMSSISSKKLYELLQVLERILYKGFAASKIYKPSWNLLQLAKWLEFDTSDLFRQVTLFHMIFYSNIFGDYSINLEIYYKLFFLLISPFRKVLMTSNLPVFYSYF